MYAVGAQPQSRGDFGRADGQGGRADLYAERGVSCVGGGRTVLYSARLGLGRPGFGQGFDLLLDVIGATVIGGTSPLRGAAAKLCGPFSASCSLCSFPTPLNLMNLTYFTVNIVKGAFILSAALLDVARRRLLAAA